jgi:hypothetical protein
VAFHTEDQGLAPPGSHDPNPCGSFPSTLDLEVCEFPYVVNFDITSGAAEFAFIRPKSFFQLGTGSDAVLARREFVDHRKRLETLLASFTDGGECRFGVSHHEYLALVAI